MNGKYLTIILFLILGNVLAISIDYNETIDISGIENIDKIYAYGDELFLTFSTDSSIWRYKIDYEELELERVRSIGSEFNGIKDVWITEDIIYVLENGYVYKINYDTKKELFKGNSDSYFPDSPYAITIGNEGNHIYLVDRERKRINIMEEYDKNKYLSKGSMSVSSHGVQANFEEPYDIAISEERMYVLDKGLEQIFVYNSEEPYEYIDVLAKGKKAYVTENPLKIEVDELFVYIFENYNKITLMDKMSGEKIESIVPECDDKIEDFTFANDKLYVMCDKEELLVYTVDKRTTKTKEQVETLYSDILNRIKIACELNEAAQHYKLNVQNKCEEFQNMTYNYTYTNNNDAYEELNGLNAVVVGYIAGVGPQLNSKIEQNVSYYMDEMLDEVPYEGTKNYSATRIIWDLQEILDLKDENKYHELVEKSEIVIKRYNDFIEVESEVEDENEEEEEIIVKEEELVKILNDFEYYKPLIENYSFFKMKILEIEEFIIEVEQNESLIEKLEIKINSIKEEYVEYKENYDKVNENIERIEEEFNELKQNLFVNVQEIELEMSCAKDNFEIAPNEAWVCLQNAEKLIESEKKNSENLVFMGIFVLGFIVISLIFIILIGIGVYKIIKKKKLF